MGKMKKLELRQNVYNTIKDWLSEPRACHATVMDKVEKELGVSKDLSHRIVMAVRYDYKYLKVIQ